MERGRLFSRSEPKCHPVYHKEFSLDITCHNYFFDKTEKEYVSHEEALTYDKIMSKIIAHKFD